MWVAVITLFPDMFQAISEFGVSARALREEKAELHFWNPRDFVTNQYQSVDDRPFGGGPGMVMQVEPLEAALKAAQSAANEKGLRTKVVYLSPQGKVLNQAAVSELSHGASQEGLILIAGRYEGIDERFIEHYVDEEWSIGDYVLSGGELACMVLLDCILRQIPGALGHEQSAKFDSFAEDNEGLLDCPHYTRPEEALGEKVPAVLLSGHHEKIKHWRLQQSVLRTQKRRPDILARKLEENTLSEDVKKILADVESQQSKSK